MSSDLERRIRERAFELWQAEGQPEGRDAHHWSRAEAELAEAQAVEEAASAAAAPKRRKRVSAVDGAAPSPSEGKPVAERARRRTSKPQKR